ncbi:MAG: right-handed parallel beta-helix repeat-containing protein [Armatimonadota bacterium]
MVHTDLALTFVALCALCFCAAAAHGRELAVSPGAPGEPVIGKAIEAASPGDVIRVLKGVYQETIIISKPISIVGEVGAVVDPSQPFRPDWRPAEEAGKGVYRAQVGKHPRVLCLDGRIIPELNPENPGCNSEKRGDWYWRKLLATGPPLTGFALIRGLWVYREEEKAIYVHLADDADPASRAWSASWEAAPIIAFRGAADASVAGLTLAHGYRGVTFEQGTRNCALRDCTIGPWDAEGVYLRSGASDCLVEHNEIFRGAYEDWVPHDTSRELYEVWLIHKEAGFWDRVGIDMVRTGAGNRIHANHVYETFDGIDLGDSATESLSIPLHDPDDGRDTEIWDNVIERTRDSGIELGVGCINVRVHHNVLRQTHGGLRYKLPRIGPVFIYRNVLIDGAPYNIWYSMDASPAEGYVYHNTIIGGKAALAYQFRSNTETGTPNWHYLNNLVIGAKGFFEPLRGARQPNFIADYNVALGGGRPFPGDPSRDSHSRYVDSAPLTPGFPPIPLPDSPAVDAGLDLSTYFHGKPLPGCEPGYFRGNAPDAGAYEVE